MVWYGVDSKFIADQSIQMAINPAMDFQTPKLVMCGNPLPRTVAEFFAGIGLMRMGLERTGWQVVFANDIMPDKEEMYRANFGHHANEFVLGDIHQLPADRVPDCTLATASFPCTDLSLAGGRRGLNGSQSSAFWGFVRILDEMGKRRPPIVLLENVAAFMTSNGGADFESALLALNRLGYAVDALIIDAAHFVPQSRVRLFVIGVHSSCFPAGMVGENASFFQDELRPKALSDFIFTHANICWGLRSVPSLPESSTRLEGILEEIPADSLIWWSRERANYLVSQMIGPHAKKIDSMKSASRWSYGTAFRRVRNGKSVAELRTDGLAGCLRTPKGGSAKQILVKAGFGQVHVRLLTPRECACLMGADDFIIETSPNQALFGFGDAVCVPVVQWIAGNYLDPLLADLNEAKQSNSVECQYAVG